MQTRALHPRQTNACLRIFGCLGLERATRQRHPLLQYVMCRFKLPDHRWKRSLKLGTSSRMQTGELLPWQTNACLPNVYFLQLEMTKRQRFTPLQQVTCRLRLPAHCWKRSLQLGTCSGDANGSTSPMENKCQFANLWLFGIGEVHEAASPSFTIRYASIQASSSSLETLIETWSV